MEACLNFHYDAIQSLNFETNRRKEDHVSQLDLFSHNTSM